LRFSQPQLWMLPSSEIQRCVVRMWADISEERITSIFRVENQPSKKTACMRWLDNDFRRWKLGRGGGYVPPKRQFTCWLHGAVSQDIATFIKHLSSVFVGCITNIRFKPCNIGIRCVCRKDDVVAEIWLSWEIHTTFWLKTPNEESNPKRKGVIKIDLKEGLLW
jgi:hypothetical protein